MKIPTIVLPDVKTIETVEIPLPTADVPSYVPLVVPPSDLQEPEGTKPVQTVDPHLNQLYHLLFHLTLYHQLRC